MLRDDVQRYHELAESRTGVQLPGTPDSLRTTGSKVNTATAFNSAVAGVTISSDASGVDEQSSRTKPHAGRRISSA